MEPQVPAGCPLCGAILLEAMYQGALDYPAQKGEAEILATAHAYFMTPGHHGSGTPQEIDVFVGGYAPYVAPSRDDEAVCQASELIKAVPRPSALAIMRVILPEHLGGGH